MRTLSCIVASLFAAGCATWHGATDVNAKQFSAIACAKTFYVGGAPRPGIPLLPMEPADIQAVARRIERAIPHLKRVDSESAADLVVTVIFTPRLPICTHCEEKPNAEWASIIWLRTSRGEEQYFGTTGTVWFGTNVIGAFVEQLKQVLPSEKCVG